MRVYLGLGSNLGERAANIASALRRLSETPGITAVGASSVIETKPVGGSPQPDFLNAACEVSTTLTPIELLRVAKSIERAMGRKRTVRWGPRIIDIDILLCGEMVVEEPELTVPHPRMAEREFVLKPLAEIAPDARHPVTHGTVREMLANLRQHRVHKAKNPMAKSANKVTSAAELGRMVARWKAAGQSIGLVPTMGALHAGHVSLVKRSAAENSRTIVSVFVNPKQFGPKEDFGRYPRQLADDIKMCAEAGADAVYAPPVEDIYPDGYATYVSVEGLTDVLCGKSRPGHFRGVTTVCAKLFGIARCDRAYFGEKDYQQLTVIRRMARDLNMSIEIVPCPIVRLGDGLAMSSRNKYLTAEQRIEAPVLYRSLVQARRLVEEQGVTHSADVIAAIKKIVTSAPCARIDYVSIVHPETLQSVRTIRGEAVIALAVFFGKTRLIDNMKVQAGGK